MGEWDPVTGVVVTEPYLGRPDAYGYHGVRGHVDQLVSGSVRQEIDALEDEDSGMVLTDLIVRPLWDYVRGCVDPLWPQ